MNATHNQSPVNKVGITPGLVWSALRRHPVWLVVIVLFAGMVAAGVWFLLPLPKNTVMTIFHIPADAPQLLDKRGGGGAQIYESYKQNQVASLRSRVLLSEVLKKPELKKNQLLHDQPDQLVWINNNLIVRFDGEFMRVSLEGDFPDDMLPILQGIQKAYLEKVDEDENGGKRRQKVRLEKALRENQVTLEKFRTTIDGIANQLGASTDTAYAIVEESARNDIKLAQGKLTDLRERLMLLEKDGFAKGGLDDRPEKKDVGILQPEVIPQDKLDEAVRRDKGVIELEHELSEARHAVSEIESRLQPNVVTPALTKAKVHLQEVQSRVDNYKKDIQGSLINSYKESLAKELREREERRRAEIEAIQKNTEAAKQKFDDSMKVLQQKSRFRTELDRINNDYASVADLQQQLSKKINELALEINAGLNRITVSEDPYVMTGIEGNRRLRMSIIGGVVALLAGLALVVFLEQRNRRVVTAEELAKSNLPIMASVPPITVKGKNNAHSVLFAEAMDTARTLLLHVNGDRGHPRTVMIASAYSGEGKTSFAGHLAISLTRAGYKTLLVDGDLRCPTAHNVFNVPEGPGFCEILRGESAIEDSIYPSPLPGLSILPAGTWNLGVRAALAGPRWSQVKQELESIYDYVIVDSSPVLLVTDGLLFAKAVDAVLLSVLLGHSRHTSLDQAYTRLKSVGANVIGLVVNGVPAKGDGYYYSRKYANHYLESGQPENQPV